MIGGWKTLRQALRRYQLKRLRPGKTREELLTVIRNAEAIGSGEERRLLERFASFHDLRIREVMTPRSDMISIDCQASLQQAAECMMAHRLVRMPVTEGGLDHIVGVIHIRPLFAAMIAEKNEALHTLLVEPIWVSELERVSSLLSRMRSQSHVAIARDEFGGTAGLVTLSDLLGEIFGRVSEWEESGSKRGSDVLAARTRIEELDAALRLVAQDVEGDFDTLGGMLITLTGRIPQQGETIELADWSFTIEQASPRRIESVRVFRLH